MRSRKWLPLRVRHPDRRHIALDSEDAIVAGEIEAVFRGETGQKTPAGVNRPEEVGGEGDGFGCPDHDATVRGAPRNLFGSQVAGRWHRQRVQVRPVGIQDDDAPRLPARIGGPDGMGQKRAATLVGVERFPRHVVVARLVCPPPALAGPGNEHVHDAPAQFPHQQPPVRENGESVGALELPRPLSRPPQRLDMRSRGVVHADVLCLGVEHVHISVAVHRERRDASEDVFLRPVQIPDRHLGHQCGFGSPHAPRQGSHDRRVADGLHHLFVRCPGTPVEGARLGAAGEERNRGGGEGWSPRRHCVPFVKKVVRSHRHCVDDLLIRAALTGVVQGRMLRGRPSRGRRTGAPVNRPRCRATSIRARPVLPTGRSHSQSPTAPRTPHRAHPARSPRPAVPG